MTSLSLAPRPIVVVTGANGGIGYGICQRLLAQLCHLNPEDAQPQSFASNVQFQGELPKGYEGLTLIMACRNLKRAEAARTKLVQWFDLYVDILKNRKEYDGHAVRFHGQCDIQIQELDLASIRSVLKGAAALRQRLPYISHLICNAGVASFKSIDWVLCTKEILTNPMRAVTAPCYYSQYSGELSIDNVGWVWQCNLFSHFALFRELESLLSKTPFENARVIWCSSLEASPTFYDSADWQLKATPHSYESSKYQIDIVATTLDELAVSAPSEGKPIRHFVSEPGVCSTPISDPLTGPFLNYLKVLVFYLVRLLGSPHHTILPMTAAVAAVHLILAPLSLLPKFLDNDTSKPVRFGANTDRWGNALVGRTEVKEWDANKKEGLVLIKKCDELLQELKKEELEPPQFETASEKM